MPIDDKKIIMVGSGDPCNRSMIYKKLMKDNNEGLLPIDADRLHKALLETYPMRKLEIPEVEMVTIFKHSATGMTESLITGYHYFDTEKFKRTFSSKPYVDKSVKEFCSGPLGEPYVGK